MRIARNECIYIPLTVCKIIQMSSIIVFRKRGGLYGCQKAA